MTVHGFTPCRSSAREAGRGGLSLKCEHSSMVSFLGPIQLHDPHPRGAGAFPRVLGHYVREEKVLPLELAIHKMTGLPASRIGLRDRGRIAKGYVADLVLFDPAVIIDRSTIEHPDAARLGIPAVMVSGEWVVDGGRITGRHPGVVLRPMNAPH
jgi:N-acyl-D-amino-acid deacylase